jgi:hypothetical protein
MMLRPSYIAKDAARTFAQQANERSDYALRL